MDGPTENGPYYRRNMRILVLLAVGVVMAAGVVMALNSSSRLAAFNGSPGCPTGSGHPRDGHPHRHLGKGAEMVTTSSTPTSRSSPAPEPSGGTESTDPGTCPTPTGGEDAAGPNPNCTLVVPADPLSAQGLATPYRLTATDPAQGPCHEANAAQSAFVQATIINPATGRLSVYDPLVVDRDGRPAARPVVPALPHRAVVGIWFGYNGDGLTLRDTSGGLRRGHCVNGLGDSVFGQFAHCNARAFFAAASAAIKAAKVRVPPVGRAEDGMPCPTTRDFALVDQDQSDNVTTQYLLTGNGRTAQDTAATKDRLPDAQTLANPSDNGLLDAYVDPALGCRPWTVRDLADRGRKVTSLALNELQAATRQRPPVALVPLNNPMTLAGDVFSAAKTNRYRAGVDQPLLPAGQRPETYCRAMDRIQTARLRKDETLLTPHASPAPDEADNLFTFMGMRLKQSFENLKCANFGLTNPVARLRMKGDVVVGVVFARGG